MIYSNTTIVVNENLFKDISDKFIIEVCKFFKHYIDKVEIEENSLVIRVDDIKCFLNFLNKSSENLEKRFTKLKKDNQIKDSNYNKAVNSYLKNNVSVINKPYNEAEVLFTEYLYKRMTEINENNESEDDDR